MRFKADLKEARVALCWLKNYTHFHCLLPAKSENSNNRIDGF